jgi:hypothetical protein
LFPGHFGEQPTQEAGGHKIFQIAAPAGYRLNCSGGTCAAPVFLYTELKSFSAFPIDSLNMLVHGNSQAMSAAQTAALKDLAPISSCHASTEAVHAHPAADFRLVRTLRHSSLLR